MRPRNILLTLGLLVICGSLAQPAAALASPGDWTMWQYNRQGSRFNPSEHSIKPSNAGRLALKWSFVFGGADASSSQPSVVGGTLYVGGRDGYFYALNARTGAVEWRFDTSVVTHAQHPVTGIQGGAGVVPYFGNTAAATLLRDGPAVAGGSVYFGDNKANLYALNRSNGRLRWATKLDDFADAIITSSPVVDRGRIFVGVSSGEEAFGLVPAYSCCHFRGSVVAVDAATGRLLWRHYTVGTASQHGTNMFGVPFFEPSGAAVWASPAVDPRTRTVFVGVGNPYSGPGAGESDSMLALDERGGREKWSLQLTHADAWNLDCAFHTTGDCPKPGPDFDFAAGPNVFTITLPNGAPACLARRQVSVPVKRPVGERVVHVNVFLNGRRVMRARGRDLRWIVIRRLPKGAFDVRLVEWTSGGGRVVAVRRYSGCTRRHHGHGAVWRRRRLTVVGEGQKSGVYHVLDAATGRVLWQTELSVPQDAGGPNFQQGVQWGTSYDGRRIYVATAVAHPSQVSALNPVNGRILWRTANPSDGCSTGGAASYQGSSRQPGDCEIGMAAATTAIPGVVFEGSLDGKLRAFNSRTGKILWTYDTVRSYLGANGVSGNGGSISGAGAVVAHGMVYVNSGYNTEESPETGIHGNVLLAFGLPKTRATAATVGPAPGPSLSRAAALRRCIAAWNDDRNQSRELAAARGPHGEPVQVRANMLPDDMRCLITIRVDAARPFQLSLRRTGYQPVGEANIPPPPPRDWNLAVNADGTVAER